jgi:DNA-binding winged helix-turn-helix (wHTH) protein/predicted ATPase
VTKAENEKSIIFDPFCLDLTNECLWKDLQAIRLRPKAFMVLSYLVRHPGVLVTKEELIEAIWPGTFVGDGVLKVIVRQLRKALDDDPKQPRFIETAHRRGYRFISAIAAPRQTDHLATLHTSVNTANTASSSQTVVGRDEALSRMRTSLHKMLGGERQVLFVTGEAGIGKTTLVDVFAQSLAFDPTIWTARGQCLEQYGASEAYLPVLEAIGRLCREHAQVVDVLRTNAPMWLLQMPSLLSASDREVLSREMSGATHERMLREMGGALEVLTADRPLVLILEDLHWSDYSTLDLISYLARPPQHASLMVIGTYRTPELIVSGHPLNAVKRELLAKQQCDELPLEDLSEGQVAKYLALRFPDNRFPAKLATSIRQRTEGNPLFLVNAVEYLVAEKLIGLREQSWELLLDMENVKLGVPDSIKHMIDKQIDHLDVEEQRTLEAASIAGAEFSIAAVAGGLEEDASVVEDRCHKLAREHQFIRECGMVEASQGDVTPRYGFRHALYQNVLYERVSPSRRIQMHRRIGSRVEGLHGDHVSEVAAELAMHFDRGRDYGRAAKYLQHAAENALRRFAYQDAVTLARRGLELLEKLADTPARAHLELQLCVTLGVPLIAIEGYAAQEVGTIYTRARELCRQLGDTPEIFQVLWGLWSFYLLRADLGAAREIAEEFLPLAKRFSHPGLAMRGHVAMETTYIHLGEFVHSVEHFEKALLLYDPVQHREDAFLYTVNLGVAMRCFGAWALWFLGKPDEALQRIQEAVSLAREISEPHTLCRAFLFAAILHQLRRDSRLALESAEAAIAVSVEHNLMMYQSHATITRTWAMIDQGLEQTSIKDMREGLAARQATGTELMRPQLLSQIAEALAKAGQPIEGLHILEDALAILHHTGERYYEAELYRLKGELLLMLCAGRVLSRAAAGRKATEGKSTDFIQVERCFHQSIQIARQQKAKSLELRVSTSMARLYRDQGRHKEASDLLSAIYETFTEGFGTLDLREAKALLDDLS